MALEFLVRNQRLKLFSGGPVVADSQQYLKARFTFSEDWQGTRKYAQFRRDGEVYTCNIDEYGEVEVPWETLVGKGVVQISAFATNQQDETNKLITTNPVFVKVETSGIKETELPKTPSLGILGDSVDESLKEITDARDRYVLQMTEIRDVVLEAKDHIDQTDYKIYVGETEPSEDITNAVVWINPAEDDGGSDELAEAVTAAQNAATHAEVQAESIKKYKALWFDSVASMKAEPSLTAGAYVNTAGYYAPNDGGGASYLIREKQEADIDDGGSLHMLANGLVAELIVENGTVCPEQFGAKGDGVSDDTNKIQYVVSKYHSIKFSKKYLVTDKINVSSTYSPNVTCKILNIEGEIIFNNGYFHVHGENITINGGGTIRGSVPNAFIVLGGIESQQNVSSINNTIENIYIYSTNGGIGILLCNYYLGNFGCYCNFVQNIYVENCDIAVMLLGDSNANTISNITFRTISNTRVAMCVFEGIEYNNKMYAPTENRIVHCFYFRGNDTPTFLIKSNTASRVYKNVIANCTSEQFGDKSTFLTIEEGATPTQNVFVANTGILYLGAFTSYTYLTLKKYNNIFLSDDYDLKRKIEAQLLLASNGISVGKDSTHFIDSSATTAPENTEIVLLNLDVLTPDNDDAKLFGGYIEITVIEYVSNTVQLQHYNKAVFYITPTTLTLVDYKSSKNTNRISADGLNIKYKTGDNGTNVKKVYIHYDFKITTYNNALYVAKIINKYA